MQLSAKVLRVMQGEQISPEELQIMVRDSAITSLRGSNRRYHFWLFWTNPDRTSLIDMQRVDLVMVGRGDVRMLEDHEACRGEGCSTCGWAGVISRGVMDTTEARL